MFAACLNLYNIHVWKSTSGCYTLLGKFQTPSVNHYPFQFSPNLSSILTCSRNILRVHRLDGHSIVMYPDGHTPLTVISHCGTYMVTGRQGKGTITITNLLSKIPPQLVDTDMEVDNLAITSNILLVSDLRTIVAWRLTDEGAVDNVPTGRRVDRGNSIWAISPDRCRPIFTIKDQSVIVKNLWGRVIHACHVATGEVLEPAELCPSSSTYTVQCMYLGQHHLHYRRANDQGTLPEDNWPVPLVGTQLAWAKDPEGRHRLWVPVEWRNCDAGWLPSITTLRLDRQHEGVIFIKF